MAERGLDISCETVRRWVLKFGPTIARRLRRRRPRPSGRWHLDDMVGRIARERMYLWRAVDDEGEVLDMLVQHRRDTRSALRPHCQLNLSRSQKPEAGWLDHDGATAFRHSLAASARKIRSVDRESRWH
jgi:transposase-like protein